MGPRMTMKSPLLNLIAKRLVVAVVTLLIVAFTIFFATAMLQIGRAHV